MNPGYTRQHYTTVIMNDDQLNNEQVAQTHIQHQRLPLAIGILQLQETYHNYRLLQNNDY